MPMACVSLTSGDHDVARMAAVAGAEAGAVEPLS